HLAAVRGIAAARRRVVRAAQLDDLPRGGGLYDADALDEVGVAQPHFLAGCQAGITLWRILAEVVLFDVQDPGEGALAGAGRGVFRIVDGFHFLDLALGVVLDHHAERAQHGEHPRGPLVEVVAEAAFQDAEVDDAVILGHADALTERADGLRGIAAPPEA